MQPLYSHVHTQMQLYHQLYIILKNRTGMCDTFVFFLFFDVVLPSGEKKTIRTMHMMLHLQYLLEST